jgi:hypothetical protein
MLPVRPAAIVTLLATAAAVRAQEIEPRTYSNAPIGINFLIAGAIYSRNGLEFDPSLPAENEKLDVKSGVLAYARTFGVAGRSGKFDVVMPYGNLSGSVDYAGQQVTRDVTGFMDPRFRVAVNLYGSPALPLSEFRSYRQDIIVGTSLQVIAPWGQYDGDRLVNLGTHRWSFKPEIGISKAIDRWIVELKAAATFFTTNHDFFGGHARSQEPIYAAGMHAIYTFPSTLWASFDGTYYAGGRSRIDGELSNDLQQNWRFGATLAIPVDRNNSVKLYASTGVAARTGNNYDLIGAAWQYRWGGGL